MNNREKIRGALKMPGRDSQNGSMGCLTGTRVVVSVLVAIFVLVSLASSAMAQAPADAVLIMHFDEGSGTIAKDESGNGNDGTIHGATWTEGKVNRALSFDGSNDYVEVPNVINGLNAVTIEAWFKYTNSNTWSWIYGGGPGWNYNPGMCVKSGSNVMRYHWRTTADSFYTRDGSITLNPNTWYHIAYVYDGSTIKCYINGAVDFSKSSSGTIVAPLTQAIGAGYWDNREYFYGSIDEVCIYNRALTVEEIKSHYEGNQTALSLTKSALPNYIKQGETTTVTLAVKNTGTTEIKDTTIVDSVSADFIFIGGEISKNYASLKPGDSREFQYVIQSKEVGTFNLDPATATYSDEEGDSYSALSNSVAITIVLTEEQPTPTITHATPVPTFATPAPTPTPQATGTPQITISQTSLLEEPGIGDEAMITVSLKNTGNSIARNVQLTERIPSSVLVSYVEGADNAGGLVSWSGDLNPGQSRSIQHTFRILEARDRFFTAKVTYEDAEGNKKETSTNVYITTETADEASLDSDGDGWSDEREKSAGTNPYSKDTDNDGLWDSQDPNPLVAQKPGLPGFEAIFAVAGLLAVAYSIRKRGGRIK